jgi:high affinity Mn2+ porin
MARRFFRCGIRSSVDYQFVGNPGYNTDRGPANIFAGRIHTQF